MAFRFAMFAVALAAAAPAPAQTPEADRTTIEADIIEGVSDLEVSARGNAEITRDDMTIFGEQLRYNREFGRAEGEGGVRLQRGADRFFGPRLYYNTLDDTGVFESPSYILQRERTARGSAERIEFLGSERYRLTNATYTTCEPGREDWVLHASELELDMAEEEGEAYSPRLRFFDVPIIASPWAIFPIGDRRRSGLLSPYYSQTSSRGFEIGIPYYWNIAPEYDATLLPVFMAKRGAQLKTQGRYLSRSYTGELRFEYLPDDHVFNGSREGLSWQHHQNLWRGGTLQVDYNRVSDDRYFVDLSSQVTQSSIGNLPQDASLTHAFGWGGFGGYVQVRAQAFQTLQDPRAPSTPPYHRLPQIYFLANRNDIANVFDLSVPAEYANFKHPTALEGTRSSLNPTLTAPVRRPGWFFTPKAGARYAGYNLEQGVSPGQSSMPQATIPWGSLDAGLIFERDSGFAGAGSTQTLEPRLFYVYAPYVNQDTIPVFDTGLADFNYVQLFNENRFVGQDRFGDANQLTFALTSRFLQVQGQEVLRGTLGRRYYFEPERVGIAPTAQLRTAPESDLLASLGGRVGKWSFDATTQYNEELARHERYNLGVRYSPEAAKVLNLSYRYKRQEIDQIDVSGQWPIVPGWYGVGRYNYSYLDKTLLDGLGGIEYNAGCWVFRAVVRRTQAASEVSNTAFIFQLEFNGIGAIGTDQAAELIKRNVPGYTVTNPANPQFTPPSARPRLPFEQVY